MVCTATSVFPVPGGPTTRVSPGCMPARIASTCVGVKGTAFLLWGGGEEGKRGGGEEGRRGGGEEESGGKGRVKQCLGCVQCEGVTLSYLLGWLYG